MFMCFAKYIIRINSCENNVAMSFNVTNVFVNIKMTLDVSVPMYSGLKFTKGLRISQFLGLNLVLKLRLLSQLSFVLKPYSQRLT